MKFTITLLFSILSQQISFGQVQPLNTLEKPSENHVLIPNTRIQMAPPPAFKPSTAYYGFQHTTDPKAMIMLVETPVPYAEIVKQFEMESTNTGGRTLIQKKQVTVNGIPGHWIELEDSSAGKPLNQTTLVFGDDRKTTLISGFCMKDSVVTSLAIQTALKSTFIDISAAADPRNALPFTLDENAGQMKLATMQGNIVVFTRDGQFLNESAEESMLTVIPPYRKIEIADKKAFCIQYLSKNSNHFVLESEKEVKPIEIDGLKGFKLFAKNDLIEGEPQAEMLQVILFENDGGYYIMIGSYYLGDDKALKDIEAVVKTFKRK